MRMKDKGRFLVILFGCSCSLFDFHPLQKCVLVRDALKQWFAQAQIKLKSVNIRGISVERGEKSLRQSMQRWKNPWVQWLQICKPRKDGIAIWQQPFWLVSKGIFPNFEEDCHWQHRCRPFAWLAINFMVEKTTSCFSFSSFFCTQELKNKSYPIYVP